MKIHLALLISSFIAIGSTANAQFGNWVGHVQDGPDGNSGYRVFEDGRWYDVSNRAVVKARNQDGIPRAWWSWEHKSNGQVIRKAVICFLKGFEG